MLLKTITIGNSRLSSFPGEVCPIDNCAQCLSGNTFCETCLSGYSVDLDGRCEVSDSNRINLTEIEIVGMSESCMDT